MSKKLLLCNSGVPSVARGPFVAPDCDSRTVHIWGLLVQVVDEDKDLFGVCVKCLVTNL